MGGDAGSRTDQAAGVLRVLADLAPQARRSAYDVTGSGSTRMAWLGLAPHGVSGGAGSALRSALGSTEEMRERWAVPRTRDVESLTAFDALTPGRSLAIGWLWIAGTAQVDGVTQQILRPLVSCTARAGLEGEIAQVDGTDRWDLWPLVADEAAAHRLEDDVQFGGGGLTATNTTIMYLRRFPKLLSWTNHVLEASGLPAVDHLRPSEDPRRSAEGPLRAIVGYGLFCTTGTDLLRARETLTEWTHDGDIAHTAFASLYLGPPPAPAPTEDATTPTSLQATLPLCTTQEVAVRRTRTEAVAVISGAPGTGKSQTAVALAADAVARGERVLIATQSEMAADVLADLMDREPGPTPVLFGGSNRSAELAARFADGIVEQLDPGAADRWAAAHHRYAELRAVIEADLADVQHAAAWQDDALVADAHRRRAPGLFDGSEATVTAARRLVEALRQPHHGLFGGRHLRHEEGELRTLVGALPDCPIVDIERAVEVAERRFSATRAQQRKPELAERRWAALVEAEHELRAETGRLIASRVAANADGGTRRAVAALSTALRSGRAIRRAHLRQIDAASLTKALPLWIGTLGEIEALLPAKAAAFDLVILDEASMIDQGSAAAALLRARRAVVIGDPRQLRFVSFLADADVRDAVFREGRSDLADRLDVRRVSAFDLAASVSPVTFLEEHHRSVPHLIGFSARHFYDGRMQVHTRHPSNDGVPAIEVRRVEGTRVDGVNEGEVEAARDLVHELLSSTDGTIGVISPHRPQVERLRSVIAASLSPDVLESDRVRVATVHGFQGSECDVVVASFGISDGAGRGRRFLEDPNLFNVLITRARDRMILLASVEDPPPGLLADYLAWSQTPPTPPSDMGPVDTWTTHLADRLADHGVPVHAGYRVGGDTIDLVIGAGADALAVATRVHPAGPYEHVQRHLSLHRAGWRQTESFPLAEGGAGDAAVAAMALTDLVRGG